MNRLSFLATTTACSLSAAIPTRAFAQERTFTPRPGTWRTFEVITAIEIVDAGAGSQAWIPIPGVDTNWQKSLDSRWTGNMKDAAIRTHAADGTKMLHARW